MPNRQRLSGSGFAAPASRSPLLLITIFSPFSSFFSSSDLLSQRPRIGHQRGGEGLRVHERYEEGDFLPFLFPLFFTLSFPSSRGAWPGLVMFHDISDDDGI